MCVRLRRTPSTPRPPNARASRMAVRPRSAVPGGRRSGLADWLKWAWRQLTSMRIALVLLFLLALGSVPGSMLPQEGNDPAGVQQYFTSHPALAPLLSHLGLFNVFAAPWFAAIYLLLFASLVGCVVPRTFRLAGSARTLPPRAPRNLARLPRSAEYATALPPADAVEVAARVLAGHGFRLRRAAEPARSGLRELSGPGRQLGLRGKGIPEGSRQPALPPGAARGAGGGRARRPVRLQGRPAARGRAPPSPTRRATLDEFYPGRLVTAADLGPFTITLNKFDASYITSGPQRGQPSSFDAQVSYTAHPGAPARSARIEVNQPLSVDGAKVYLIGHGYAPEFKVTDARGQVVYNGPQPFISGATGNFLSEGVLKVPGRAARATRLHRRLRADRDRRRRHPGVGVSRRGQPGGEPDRLRGQPRR